MWKYMPNKAIFGEPESSWQLLHAKALQTVPIKKLKVFHTFKSFLIKFNLIKYFI